MLFITGIFTRGGGHYKALNPPLVSKDKIIIFYNERNRIDESGVMS